MTGRPRAPPAARHSPDVSRRRYLRGGVRILHAVSVQRLRIRERSRRPPTREKVIILGSGPNRIGQGIEFDYCCVHAAWAVREAGYEAMMVNCNPETVSTDYDTSDRLYFEPLTLEHVLNIVAREQPLKGVIVQFGGQTPLNLTAALARARRPDPGHVARRDRDGRGSRAVRRAAGPSWRFPPRRTAWRTRWTRRAQSRAKIGYPVHGAPVVCAGRARDGDCLRRSRAGAIRRSGAWRPCPDQPILIDHYLEDAYEIDVDAIADGERVVIGGDHAAHRGSGRAQRRLGVCDAALQDLRLSTSRTCANTPSSWDWRSACAA